MKFFEFVEPAPVDPIFGLNTSFAADPRPSKVNLGAGVYKTDTLESFILKSVKKAEALLLEKETSKDYLSIDGLPEYVALTKTFLFGSTDERIYGAHTAGGTAALRIGGAFLKELGLKKLYLSHPTWVNHNSVFKQAGLEVGEYTYLNQKNLGFDFEGCINDLNAMEPGSIVVLHACCHNPTGFDPTPDQWKVICAILKEQELFPFFDCSYQGFGDHFDEDVAPIRSFLKEGLSFAVAVSHSKNFGLYAERCGGLYLACSDQAEAKRVGSRVKVIIRGLYSNPPCHGARIITTIWQQDELRVLWEQELTLMRERISEMRRLLAQQLKNKKINFEFLLKQKGMFSYTGLSRAHVTKLINDYGIYLPQDGRINVAGLNHDNLPYVAKAILTTVEN